MKELKGSSSANWYIILPLIYSNFLLFLIAYYLAFHNGILLPMETFWLSVIFCVSICGIQITRIQRKSKIGKLVLFQILLLSLSLKLFFVLPGDFFFGSDANLEFYTTKALSEGKEQRFASYFPFLYSYTLFLFQLSGIHLRLIATLLPLLFSGLSIILVYQIALICYNDEQIALSAALLFSSIYFFLLFHSLYLRESLAFPCFLGTIYYLRCYEKRNKNPLYGLLAIIMMVTIILTHLLTTILLLAFLLIDFSVPRFIFWLRQYLSPSNKALMIQSFPSFAPLRFFFASVAAFLLYVNLFLWDPITPDPLRSFEIIFRQIANKGAAEVSTERPFLPSVTRYYVVFFLEVVIAVIVGVSLFYFVFKKAFQKQNYFDLSLMIWGALMGFLTLVIAFGILIPGQGVGFGARFELFGLPFLFLLIAQKSNSLSRSRHGKIAMITFFLLVSLSNLYRFNPAFYSDYEPQVEKGEYSPVLTKGQERGLMWFKEYYVLPFGYPRNLYASPTLDGYIRCFQKIRGYGDDPRFFYILSSFDDMNTSAYSVISKIYDNSDIRIIIAS